MFCIILLRVYLPERTRKHLPFHRNLSKNNSLFPTMPETYAFFQSLVLGTHSLFTAFLEEPLFEDKAVIWGKLLEHKSYDNLALHTYLCPISTASIWETINIFKQTEVSLCLLNFYIELLHMYYRSFGGNRKTRMQRKDYSA